MQRQRVWVDARIKKGNVCSPKSKLLLIPIKCLTGKTGFFSLLFCLVNSKLSWEGKVVLTTSVDQT